jgi:DNA polymerase III alpha subunit (gram-positive type)
VKLFYFDTETTGTHLLNDDVWQIAGIVEEDGKVVDAINLKMQPRKIDRIPEKLYEMFGTTREEMLSYQPREVAFEKLIAFFAKHTDINTRDDSLIPCGHNAAGFDMGFFKKLFEEEFKHKKQTWQHLLDYHCIDTMLFAQLCALSGVFPEAADSLKLNSVCEYLGIEFNEDEAHDALYDVKKTREALKKFMEMTTINPV